MKKVILLTGSTGFIGHNIAKLLVQEDFELRLFVRKEIPHTRHHNIKYVFGDIRNYEDVLKAAEGCDIVIHSAGLFTLNQMKKDEIYEVNVKGTENICKACIALKIERLIYTSSAATIGKSASKLSDETTEFNLWNISSHYKKSKVLSEKIVFEYFNQYSLPVIILNPSLPLGNFDFKPTSTGAMVESFIKTKKVIYINGGFNFVHVEDVAKAHLLAINRGTIGERYIIGNANMELVEFYRRLCKIFPKNKITQIPYLIALSFSYLIVFYSFLRRKEPEITPQGVMLSRKKMFYDNTKSKRDLGLDYRPIDEALKESVNWFNFKKYGYKKDL